ncbi:MAG: NUDIX hydrolase [Pseudomonadota bacterium]
MPSSSASKPANAPGRASRPRDAATLVLYRRIDGELTVLMGQRSASMDFMPDAYVFPGGAVDRADGYAPSANELNPRVAGYLEKAASAHRARALGLAAIRETFEETGLVLGERWSARPTRVPPSWRAFCDTGYLPALAQLDYLYRAITPPLRTKRFNARFLIADGEQLAGDIQGSGELLFVDWIPIARALSLNLPNITKVVLENVESELSDPDAFRARTETRLFHTVRGKRVEEYE